MLMSVIENILDAFMILFIGGNFYILVVFKIFISTPYSLVHIYATICNIELLSTAISSNTILTLIIEDLYEVLFA